jgi:hypothetical protein
MPDSAKLLADRLRGFAIRATEIGRDHRCSVHLRLDSEGLLVVAVSLNGQQQAATVVPWPDVLAHDGGVTAAMGAVVVDLEHKQAAAEAGEQGP